MSGTPVRILLARHGETVYNVEGRWQGQFDSPLTPRGLEQARQLGQTLRHETITAAYSSDLGRAMHTAREVAHLHGLPVIAEPRIREIDVGRWTGLNRAQILADFADEFDDWAHRPARARLPDGESLAEAQTRALRFFHERMPAHVGETIVVIAHGALHQAILVEAMGKTLADLWLPERVENCQLSHLAWANGSGLRLTADVENG
jgi:broad specificity phosphatase PhoE